MLTMEGQIPSIRNVTVGKVFDGMTSIGKMFLHLDDAFVGNQFKPFLETQKNEQNI